jgi:hypothetical protein
MGRYVCINYSRGNRLWRCWSYNWCEWCLKCTDVDRCLRINYSRCYRNRWSGRYYRYIWGSFLSRSTCMGWGFWLYFGRQHWWRWQWCYNWYKCWLKCTNVDRGYIRYYSRSNRLRWSSGYCRYLW